MKLLLLVALLGVAYVAAECPEACNGHGFCGEYDKPVYRSRIFFLAAGPSVVTGAGVGALGGRDASRTRCADLMRTPC